MNEQRRFWMRWRVRLGYPVALVFWLFASPTRQSIVAGGIIAAIGLFVRAAAAGYLRKNQELATAGPYARTRNPLYFGSAILAAGFVIAGHSWVAGALVMAYFSVFYYAVMRNEEDELRSRFGVVFDRYAARVPLFFPRGFAEPPETLPHSGGARQSDFSWEQYRRNREYRALIGTLLGLAFVCVRMWIPLRELVSKLTGR
jgi:protein-S-isoprenylcysteine O-methyltransferase Ste14